MKILKFLAQALSCTAVFLLGQNLATAQGLHYTPQEIAIWKQRSTSGPYRVAGDAGTNTPPDWTRINQYADDFLASNLDSGNTQDESLDIWTGYRYVIDSLNQYPTWQGIKMEAAAFKYLLFKDVSFGNAVKQTLLAQVRFTDAVNIGYNVANWPVPNNLNTKPTYESGVNEALWLLRLLYAYDYTKDLYSAAEQQEIEQYFQASAAYFSNRINDKLAQCFPNRLNNDYSVKLNMAAPGGVPQWNPPIYAPAIYTRHQVWGDGYIYTHRNADGTLGNKISRLSLNYNNRMFDKMEFIGMCGLLTNNQPLLTNAVQTAKEFIMYGVWPDGTYGEYERNGDYGNPNQGAMLYGSKNLQFLVHLADALARRGDFSLYQFSTTDGVHGTQVAAGGQSKSILTIMNKYANNAVGNPSIYYGDVAPLNRIDINNESTNTTYTLNHVTWDYLLATANKYYQSDYLKKVYTRQASVGAIPYPTKNLSSAGMVWIPWSGTGAEYPGLLFMFGQMENAKAYAAPCLPTSGVAVSAIGSDSAILTWMPNLNVANGYRVEYKDINTSIWIALKANTTKITLQNLSPSVTYQVRVKNLCSKTDSGTASTPITFSTIGAPCKTPAGLALTAPAYNQIKVDASLAPNVNLVLVEYRTQGSTAWTQQYSSALPATISGVQPITAYEVRTTSVCAGNNSNPSNTVVITTPAIPCPTPTGIALTAPAYNQIQVNATLGTGVSSVLVEYRTLGSTPWSQQAASALPATIVNLQAVTAYEVRLTSVCTSNNSTPSSTAIISTPSMPCGQGTNLKGIPTGKDSAVLSWNPASGAAQYQVRLRQTGTANWKFVIVADAQYREGLLNQGATYEFQVNTICQSGISGYTASTEFTIPVAQVCDSVSGITVTNITQTSAKVSWAAAKGNASGYIVRYRPLGGFTWAQEQVSTTSTTLNQLPPESDFEVQVQNVCSGGLSTWPQSQIFTTQALPCATPSNVQGKPAKADTVIITWTAAPQSSGYTVKITERGKPSPKTYNLGPAQTSLKVGSVKNGTTYDIEVSSSCVSGQSITATASVTVNITDVVAKATPHWAVAPNPTQGGATRLYGPDGAVAIAIYDSQGKLVSQARRQIEAGTVDLADLLPKSPGVYAIRAQTAVDQYKARVIVE